MDTRTKIVNAEGAARIAEQGAKVVSGYFDPITAVVAERLATEKNKEKALLVLIVTAPDTILPPRARAELVAGLRCVDYVCEEPSEICPDTRLEEEHRVALQELIRHVHRRQQAKSEPATAHSAGASSQRASQ